MPKQLTTSLVLWGCVKENSWMDWYMCINKFAGDNGFDNIHFGIKGDSFKSGKIMSKRGVEKKIYNSINNRENIVSMALYSLPEEYKQASFDYDLYMGLSTLEKAHVILSTTRTNFDFAEIGNELRRFVYFEKGQVFQMSNHESPQFYAYQVNPRSMYSTLNVLNEF